MVEYELARRPEFKEHGTVTLVQCGLVLHLSEIVEEVVVLEVGREEPDVGF